MRIVHAIDVTAQQNGASWEETVAELEPFS
jgi:hypothetical protein